MTPSPELRGHHPAMSIMARAVVGERPPPPPLVRAPAGMAVASLWEGLWLSLAGESWWTTAESRDPRPAVSSRSMSAGAPRTGERSKKYGGPSFPGFVPVCTHHEVGTNSVPTCGGVA